METVLKTQWPASYSKACSSLSVLYLVVSRRSLPLSTAESLTKTLLTSQSASSHGRGLISKCLWPKFTSLPDTLCMKGAQTIHDWIIWQLLWAQPKKARVLYQNSAFYSFYIVFLVFMEMAIIMLQAFRISTFGTLNILLLWLGIFIFGYLGLRISVSEGL